jgi:hypothetical protein
MIPVCMYIHIYVYQLIMNINRINGFLTGQIIVEIEIIKD